MVHPGRGRTKQGYFWAIARDDRPWGGSQPPAVVYSYAPGRGHIHANRLLGGYRGILQCDGCAAYRPTRSSPGRKRSSAYMAGLTRIVTSTYRYTRPADKDRVQSPVHAEHRTSICIDKAFQHFVDPGASRPGREGSLNVTSRIRFPQK
jgi:Transposase IS66 family